MYVYIFSSGKYWSRSFILTHIRSKITISRSFTALFFKFLIVYPKFGKTTKNKAKNSKYAVALN